MSCTFSISKQCLVIGNFYYYCCSNGIGLCFFLPFLKRRQYNMMSIENDERIKALEIDRNHDKLYFLVGWGRTFKDVRAQNLPTFRFFPIFCCS